MGRGSSSLLSRGATPRFTRYPRRVVKPSPCRRPFPAPSFLISRPTAPNFLFAASLAYWRNATLGFCPYWVVRPVEWVIFVGQGSYPQWGLGMGRKLFTRKGTACTERKPTAPNPERLLA